MTDRLQSERNDRVTLRQAALDLGWVSWILIWVIGAPSVLALGEAVYQGFHLADPLRWILQAHHRLVVMLEVLLKPLGSGISFVFNRILGWHLVVGADWASLLLIAALPVSADFRINRRNRIRKFFVGLSIVLIATLLVSGAMFEEGDMESSLMRAAWSAAFPGMMLLLWGLEEKPGVWDTFTVMLPIGMVFGLFAVILADVLGATNRPVAAFGMMMFLFGIGQIFTGLREADINRLRFGLLTVGGFLAAGVVFLSGQLLNLFNG